MFPIVALLAACGGGAPAIAPTGTADTREREDVYAALEVGADFATTRYVKLTDAPFLSSAHGERWVDVYVSANGAAAYEGTGDIPVGTVIVKASWLDAAATRPGPIFVMEKRAPGYAPTHGDWWYAIHWANPPADAAKRFGGPFYWRGRSARVQYCTDCHDAYDRGLGGLIPSSILRR